jgi:thiamine kinase-like enzyme
LLFLEEDKNELGDGGSDPSTQTGLSIARCWAQDKVRPILHPLSTFIHSS